MYRFFLLFFLFFSGTVLAQLPNQNSDFSASKSSAESSNSNSLSQLSEYWQVAPQAAPKLEPLQNPLQNPSQNPQEKLTAKTDSKKLLPIFNERKPTPSRFFAADISMPDHFSTSNNLIKKVGSFYRAFGEVIFVKGTITDSFGVPIEGAVVEIWQTNAAGKYHSLLDPDSEYIDQNFNMSGRAITDNIGVYDFITIMPGANPGRAPHINMNIYHPKFGKLQTEMYFEDHPYNASDYQYLSYSLEDQKLLTAKVRRSNFKDKNSIKICTFNIVMRGIQQYKSY
ncbi:MAG: protocatechuate 3,4-dioxygenase [Rickettsiales bacterium]|nr:protocatechuate 3,4-dioxygenase [Rickettsiales bacterium]